MQATDAPPALDAMFRPRSVALVGASDRPDSIGAITLRNLRGGGFAGPLYLVNPRHDTIDGLRCYPDAASLPDTPDLAVVATPPDQVPGVIDAFGTRGTRAAVVITAGFGELGEAGKALQAQLVERARAHGMRVVGPNCVGLIAPGIGLNASFAQVEPPAGEVAFISQSGALITAVLDWTQPRGIGFSQIVSLGDMCDVDFADAIDYAAADPATRTIVLYVEGVMQARPFMGALEAAARRKPVLAIKVGRHAASAKAARSHTGALAGNDAVYDAAFRRAGVLRLDTLADLLDAIETFAFTKPQRGERLAIITNGGGPGVLATDTLIAAGGTLATLSSQTAGMLDGVLPPTWSHGNPIDIVGDAPPERYARALDILLDDASIDALLVLNCPTALTDPTAAARAVVETLRARGGAAPNVYTAWLGDQSAAPARALLRDAHVATYDTPDDAIAGFMDRVRSARGAAASAGAANGAPLPPPDVAAARAAIEAARAAGRPWLDAQEVASVLSAYHIPVPASREAVDPEAAGRAAEEIGGPVALKIRSAQLTHKSDAGGVALDLVGADRVRDEAVAMLARIRAAHPEAQIDGFLVQAMVHRPDAFELIAGMHVDDTFGPVILFGQGGTAVELLSDSSLELPPLDRALARAQIERTRVARLLHGYRGRPAAALDAIADVLVRIAQLAAAHPQIEELDINPLIADAQGVLAVDARIGVRADGRSGAAAFTIDPQE